MKTLLLILILTPSLCFADKPVIQDLNCWRNFQPPIREKTPATLAITSEHKIESVVVTHTGAKDTWNGKPQNDRDDIWFLRNGPEYPIGAKLKVTIVLKSGKKIHAETKVEATH